MDQQTDGPMDQQTNGWMDRLSYRDAWAHLKKSLLMKKVLAKQPLKGSQIKNPVRLNKDASEVLPRPKKLHNFSKSLIIEKKILVMKKY